MQNRRAFLKGSLLRRLSDRVKEVCDWSIA